MWEKVAKRSHKPVKIFPFGAGSDEVMLFGTVEYELKDGKKASVDWAARAHFAQEDGALKMDFYQVYLVWPFAILGKPSLTADDDRRTLQLCRELNRLNITTDQLAFVRPRMTFSVRMHLCLLLAPVPSAQDTLGIAGCRTWRRES